MPIAEAQAISLVHPVLLTVMAVCFLGERVSPWLDRRADGVCRGADLLRPIAVGDGPLLARFRAGLGGLRVSVGRPNPLL